MTPLLILTMKLETSLNWPRKLKEKTTTKSWGRFEVNYRIDKKADDKEIRKAFKKLTREFHPDKQNGKTDEEKEECEEKFKEINEAYQVLTDPTKRRQYLF